VIRDIIKLFLLQFGSRITCGVQSLGESKYKRLILGGFHDGISHREATHLSGSCGGCSTLLVAASVSRIGQNRVGWTGAVK